MTPPLHTASSGSASNHGERSAGSVGWDFLYQFPITGISVAAATGVTHPLDVLKVRLQMQLVGERGRLIGMGDLCKHLLTVKGPQAFYLGLGPALTRSLFYGGLRLGLYEPCKHVCELTMGSTSFLMKIASGSFSGALATALTNPMEIVKVRMQMHSGSHKVGSIREMQKIVCEEGMGALWKGVGPAMARAAALTASQLATYDECKQVLRRWALLDEGFHLHFISSVVSGIVGTLVTSPVDMVKTRLMLQKESRCTRSYKNGFHCAYKVALAEGPQALYKGFNHFQGNFVGKGNCIWNGQCNCWKEAFIIIQIGGHNVQIVAAVVFVMPQSMTCKQIAEWLLFGKFSGQLEWSL